MASNKEQRGNNNESGSSGKKGVQDRIDEIISQDRVVIFSKSTCPYCDDAKKVHTTHVLLIKLLLYSKQEKISGTKRLRN